MRSFLVPKSKFLLKVRQINYIYVRLLSKSNDATPITTFNPFKRSSYQAPKDESDSRNASRIVITILGNGGVGQPRCVGLFTEFKSYLFNCGEGTGRYCTEYDINTCLIKHVFATQRKWENVSGIADVYVSNKTHGLFRMSLYGPKGVEQVLSMVSSKELDTTVTKKEGGYIDHTVDVDYIPIIPKCEGQLLYQNSKREPYLNEPEVYCYVCKIREKPGDFLVEKCIEYGVPIGPDLLKLKNWENIDLPCGKTIYAEDVHGLTYPERIILIVDCPSEYFLESFVYEKRFQKYQMPLCLSEVSIFHFTPAHIFKSKKYQLWINRFHPNTEHFVLNSDNSIFSSKVIHQTQKYLNLIHPEIFSHLRDSEFINEQSNGIKNKIIYPPPMMQIYLRPEKKFCWSNVVKHEDTLNVCIDGSDIVMSSQEFHEKLKNLKVLCDENSFSRDEDKDIYPEVLFLGTSSAISTAYRNVSAILLNISSSKSILLDCGEGTMMQLVRYFGQDVYTELQKISCIFISHKHTDHYLGLFNLITERIKAFQNAGMPYKKLCLILPYYIEHTFKNFCEVFENLHSAVKLYNCSYLRRKRHQTKKFIGDFELFTVPVIHCTDAWGIVIESNSQWKIVYSGDAAPCQALIDAGKDCTLLIHEASIEDGLISEALAKKHSTPSQVIDITEKMNAQHTIMTHFSKRYLGFPVLPENCSKEIACAFDFMKVRKCDLPLLPLFTPVIKCLFEEQLKSNAEKFSWLLDPDKRFFNIYKSHCSNA